MLNFKAVIFFSFIILISTLFCVSAADNAYCNNFTELNAIIDESGGVVNLTGDYDFIANDSYLEIDRGMDIQGNNHKLDFNDTPLILSSNQSVLFENVSFKNLNQLNLSNNVTSLNLTFRDCDFDYNHIAPSYLTVETYDYKLFQTGAISSYIKDLASSIVGNLKGIDACKKLAKWVGSNIVHETREGFYQSPLDTLLRKKGNCCSQTNLFLQMCDAVGALAGHKVYYIHVGNSQFGQRHFFCMIDNVVIDVDSRPGAPWGKAGFNGRDVYVATPYPYLPLPREY